ncbi:MAG: hypothetical protein WKF44_05000 [Rubrobacteraceae bacterium]
MRKAPGDDPGAHLHHLYITGRGWGFGDTSGMMSSIARAVRPAEVP